MDLCEFKASLVYRMGSRAFTQKNSVSGKKKLNELICVKVPGKGTEPQGYFTSLSYLSWPICSMRLKYHPNLGNEDLRGP